MQFVKDVMPDLASFIDYVIEDSIKKGYLK